MNRLINRSQEDSYQFLREINPGELGGAAIIRMPAWTMAPAQYHRRGFLEKIIVKKGTLLIEKLCNEYGDTELNLLSPGDSISIDQYVAHRLGNATSEPTEFIVEFSPAPYKPELEPNFPAADKALVAMYREIREIVAAEIIKKPTS